MTAKALEGLHVLELSDDSIACSYCTKLLADLGAEVIKIEKPIRGDEIRRRRPFFNNNPHNERSGLFLYLNTNKQGITLNIGSFTGRQILKQLLKDNDVFIMNHTQKQMKRDDLEYNRLKKDNPGLIMASITPFGQTGPYRDYKAYDINLTAAGGVSLVMGLPEREPLSLPVSLTGFQSGLSCASATLAAYLYRESAKKGQFIDISEAETWAALFQGHEVLLGIHKYREARRTGRHPWDFPYPNSIFQCKDGYVMIAAVEGKHWRTLLELMGNPEWAKDPRFKNRTNISNMYADEVDGYITPWLIQKTKKELVTLGIENKLSISPLEKFDEILNNAHLRARGFFVEAFRSDTGPIEYPGAPCIYSETPWQLGTAAPMLGEHNQRIYTRLGYSDDDIVSMFQMGII